MQVIAQVPQERLLLESDLENPGALVKDMHAMLGTICEARGWTPDYAAQITHHNALRFFNGDSAPAKAPQSIPDR